MTRSCTQCDQIVGENCPRCGSDAIPLNINSSGHAMRGTDFICACSSQLFTEGDGGAASGICESCMDVESRAAHQKAETRKRAISGAKFDAYVGFDDAYIAIQRLRDMLKAPDSYTSGAWCESMRELKCEGDDGWQRALAAMTAISKNLAEHQENR